MAFGVTLAASVVGLVLGGRWADRSNGLPHLLTSGIALFVAGLLLASVAPSMPVFLLGRGLQGLGGGMLSVALYIVVARAYPAEMHARMFAAFSAAWVVPAMIGPGVAGLLIEQVHWRSLFLGVAILTLACTPWVMGPVRRLGKAPQPPSGHGSGTQVAWAIAAALAVAALHQSGQYSGAGAQLAQAVCVLVLAIACRQLVPTGTLVMRNGLPSVIGMRGLASAAFFGTEVFLPLLLARERGLSPALAGSALTLGALGWFSGSWLRSRLATPDPVRMVRMGMGLLASGIALSALSLVPEVPLLVALLGWYMAGVGMGLVRPTLAVLTLALSTADAQGRNAASLQLFDALFTACVLAVSGSVLAHLLDTHAFLGHSLVFVVSISLALAGTLLASRIAVPGDPRDQASSISR